MWASNSHRSIVPPPFASIALKMLKSLPTSFCDSCNNLYWAKSFLKDLLFWIANSNALGPHPMISNRWLSYQTSAQVRRRFSCENDPHTRQPFEENGPAEHIMLFAPTSLYIIVHNVAPKLFFVTFIVKLVYWLDYKMIFKFQHPKAITSWRCPAARNHNWKSDWNSLKSIINTSHPIDWKVGHIKNTKHTNSHHAYHWGILRHIVKQQNLPL